MSTKICTSIEQSEKLLILGLDPRTADMFYATEFGTLISEPPYEVEGHEPCIPFTPAWSLTALLDVLKSRKDCNFIRINSSYSMKWTLNTSYYELANWKEKETIGETLIDTVYNTVVWLIEQGHLKVNK